MARVTFGKADATNPGDDLNAITGVDLSTNAKTLDAAGGDLGDDNGIMLISSPRGRAFLLVQNGNSDNACDVTAVSTQEVTEGSSGTLEVEDPVVSIPADGSAIIGPFSQNFELASPNAGKVAIDFADGGGVGSLAATDITLNALHLV